MHQLIHFYIFGNNSYWRLNFERSDEDFVLKYERIIILRFTDCTINYLVEGSCRKYVALIGKRAKKNKQKSHSKF